MALVKRSRPRIVRHHRELKLAHVQSRVRDQRFKNCVGRARPTRRRTHVHPPDQSFVRELVVREATEAADAEYLVAPLAQRSDHEVEIKARSPHAGANGGILGLAIAEADWIAAQPLEPHLTKALDVRGREPHYSNCHRDKHPAYGFACPCLLYTSPSPRDGLLARMPS